MIYLDNAATTYPKPPAVYKTWEHAMSAYGANPGRSGHRLSKATAQAVYNSRVKCADFFGYDPENTVFTLNCTHALNFAIKGLVKEGAHFVASDMEHNAAIRPIHASVSEHMGSCTLFEISEDEEETVWNAERSINSKTVGLVCTASSNVFGIRPPIKELAALCRRKGICFIVDAAQGGGVFPIKKSDGIYILCAAGLKGLYGPMGTVLLMTDGKFPLKTIIVGGTGSMSESIEQPDFLPDRFESGTINTAGAIALGAGVDFVKGKTTEAIYRHEISLCVMLCRALKRMRGIALYNEITPENKDKYAPVVSFNIRGTPSVQAAEELSRHGFFMRGGLHCAPLAHKKYGTIETGTVRFSPSVFTSKEDVYKLIRFLNAYC